MYFQTAAPADGELAFDIAYRVVRREVRALTDASHAARQKLSNLQRQRYLQADAKVPIDGKPLEMLDGVILPDKPLDLARRLYATVDDHMRYEKKGTGWGQGDSVWACASGYGNCTDFHSLFISLARAKHLPARFVIGFPLPPRGEDGAIAGYHCWAYFYTDELGWVPVDISEADKHPEMKDYYFGNLTEDRIAFSAGRDLNLVPPQHGPPLNFFVYPYLEVDGVPAGKEQLTLRFRCEEEVPPPVRP
jgi:transglutaminase-like putative cysteine protease